MVKHILIYFVILCIAVILGIVIHVDSGFVLISYHHWSVETPLWVAIILLIACFLVLHYLHIFFLWLKNRGSAFAQWSNINRTQKAHVNTAEGLKEFLQGNWKKAEKFLAQGAKNSPHPEINHIFAAQSAHHLKDSGRRDDYLAKVSKSSEHRIGVKILRAQFSIDENDLEKAQKILENLYQEDKNNHKVLAMLKQIYEQTNNTDGLKNINSRLKKAGF